MTLRQVATVWAVILILLVILLIIGLALSGTHIPVGGESVWR
jgi:hypothetical protein